MKRPAQFLAVTIGLVAFSGCLAASQPVPTTSQSAVAAANPVAATSVPEASQGMSMHAAVGVPSMAQDAEWETGNGADVEVPSHLDRLDVVVNWTCSNAPCDLDLILERAPGAPSDGPREPVASAVGPSPLRLEVLRPEPGKYVAAVHCDFQCVDVQGLFRFHLVPDPPRDPWSQGTPTVHTAFVSEAAPSSPLSVPLAIGIGVALLAWAAYRGRWGVMALFVRLKPEDVRSSQTREAILAAVQADPGINASEIRRRIEVPWTTLVYHLRVLERSRLLASHREGRHKRFFSAGLIDHSLGMAAALLSNSAARLVVNAIAQHAGLMRKELADLVHLAPSTVSWHVHRLQAGGLVEARRGGREVRYFPAEGLAGLVERLGTRAL